MINSSPNHTDEEITLRALPTMQTPARRVRRQPHLIVGILFYVLLITVLIADWKWPALAEIQQVNLYKQTTGFLLMAFILMQWKLYLSRQQIRSTHLGQKLRMHQWQGVMAPILFYTHSVSLGYGFQMVLSIALLITCFSGLLSPSATRINNKTYALFWLIVHVAGACTALLAMFYHVFISYTYS